MSERRELVVSRWLSAPPERLFEAFTSPELLMRWMGPRGSRMTRCQVDPREGGRFRFGLEFEGGMAIELTGVYRALEFPLRLAFSWGVEGEVDESEVTVQFVANQGGTNLLLTHRGLSLEDLEQNEAGWRELFERLEEALSGSGKE